MDDLNLAVRMDWREKNQAIIRQILDEWDNRYGFCPPFGIFIVNRAVEIWAEKVRMN